MSIDQVEEYRGWLRDKALELILDSNLLVLLVVGGIDKSLIEKNKRTCIYDEQCFDLLITLISNKSKLVITTSILTEVSNLLIKDGEKRGEVKGWHQNEQFRLFMLDLIKKYVPVCVDDLLVLDDCDFNCLGFSDVAIINACSDKTLVVSSDLRLVNKASSRGISSINFNRLRQAVWEE